MNPHRSALPILPADGRFASSRTWLSRSSALQSRPRTQRSRRASGSPGMVSNPKLVKEVEVRSLEVPFIRAIVILMAVLAVTLTSTPLALAQSAKPNIIMIMADDVGWFNIGAYHQGMMASRTPNLDRLAAEGMRFTDYYAEASCTAGRANFITGQLPIRTGLTTVGQAGSPLGMPAEAPTIATALKALSYATGQFG